MRTAQQVRDLERRNRAKSIDAGVKMRGKEKSQRIDLGLALLERFALPGAGICQEDIAIWCGCSRGNIYRLEQEAMKKLRNRLRFGMAAGQLGREEICK